MIRSICSPLIRQNLLTNGRTAVVTQQQVRWKKKKKKRSEEELEAMKAALPKGPARLVKGLHEPEYLDLLMPKIPFYNRINVQIKGFDWVVLEKFQAHVHKLAKILDIEIDSCWAAPHQALKYTSFKEGTYAPEMIYDMNVYERNIQVKNLTTKRAPIFLEAIQASLPPGVQLSMHEHTQEMTESRYIPDMAIKKLEEDIELLKQPEGLHLYENKKKKEKPLLAVPTAS